MTERENWITRVTLLEKLSDRHDDLVWRDFVAYYRGFIYGLTRRMGLNHADGEEVVQLVLLKSWNKLPDFQYDPRKGHFRGWLGRVTANAVRNYQRSGRGRFVALENEQGLAVDETEFFSADAEINRMAEEEWACYIPQLAWKNIGPLFGNKVRETYELLQQGRTVAQIAVELGLAVSSIYVYRKRIQEKMGAEIKRLQRELD
ncbi:MAG: sigma-70 family RNA polymerase sigma factor [Victivallales bacterium]|nr:sigma-70 family RNA polymerase sigma factor [Victivallales bacterium]